MCIEFRVSKSDIDTAYADNGFRLTEISGIIDRLRNDSARILRKVVFCGGASPEGSRELNSRLSKARMAAIEKVVRSKTAIPDSIIEYNDVYIPWQWLAEMVSESDMPYREEVMDIVTAPGLSTYDGKWRNSEGCTERLKEIDGGKAYRILYDRFFRRMRKGCVLIVTELIPKPETVIKPVEVKEEIPVPEVTDILSAQVEPPVLEEEWVRHLYLKTNLLGWPLLISNIAVEADLSPHWSAALPIYFSALNYFTYGVKFRTFAVQPEVRYWFGDGDGWYIGAHLSLVYYNLAVNGDERYQDHKGHCPAFGGGLAGGYRIHLKKRWKMEFALGAGVYHLHFDKFVNVHDGEQVTTKRRTYFGPDHAAVNLIYTFDLKRRK